MRRNCNLELRLVPPPYSALRPADSDDDDNHHRRERRELQQQLTIFYNGRVSVCDVTDLQARAIIMLASQEMEEKMKTLLGSEPSSPLMLQSPVCSPNSTGFSMKRSLQQFLQKRRNRIQATSPYHHTSPSLN